MAIKDSPFRQQLLSGQELTARFSAISFTRAPLTSANAFYRSKILSTDIDINPIVACAAALFPLLHRITETEAYENYAELQQALAHEIKAFEVKAQQIGTRVEKILIARFILCAVIDEIILNTSWGKHTWAPYRLLISFHHEASGDERIFLIMERLSENIPLNIDLLELLYICFSFGYQGKFRQLNNGQNELASIIDDLYQKIKWQRGELQKNLLIHNEQSLAPVASYDDILPLWLTLSFLSACLLTAFTAFNYLLAQQAAPLYQQLNAILSLLY